jgi:hypothetical protein
MYVDGTRESMRHIRTVHDTEIKNTGGLIHAVRTNSTLYFLIHGNVFTILQVDTIQNIIMPTTNQCYVCLLVVRLYHK